MAKLPILPNLYLYDDINSLSAILEINHPHNTGKISLLFTNNCYYDALIEKDKISEFIPLIVPEEMNSSKKASRKSELEKVVKVSISFNIDPVEKSKIFPEYKKTGDLSKVYFLEAYNYLTKNSYKYSARIFEDVDKFTTQNCNKKISKFKESANIKALKIFSRQDSQNASFYQIYDKVLNVIIEKFKREEKERLIKNKKKNFRKKLKENELLGVSIWF